MFIIFIFTFIFLYFVYIFIEKYRYKCKYVNPKFLVFLIWFWVNWAMTVKSTSDRGVFVWTPSFLGIRTRICRYVGTAWARHGSGCGRSCSRTRRARCWRLLCDRGTDELVWIVRMTCNYSSAPLNVVDVVWLDREFDSVWWKWLGDVDLSVDNGTERIPRRMYLWVSFARVLNTNWSISNSCITEHRIDAFEPNGRAYYRWRSVDLVELSRRGIRNVNSWIALQPLGRGCRPVHRTVGSFRTSTDRE